MHAIPYCDLPNQGSRPVSTQVVTLWKSQGSAQVNRLRSYRGAAWTSSATWTRADNYAFSFGGFSRRISTSRRTNLWEALG